MTEITTQLDELSKKTDKAFNLLNNHSDVIIGEIAKTNKLGEITYEHIDKFKKLEKIIYDLQSKISDQDKKIDLLTNTLKTKRSRESEPEPKPVTKKAKIRDEYIERLKSGRGKSREWSPGMSKYSSVSYNSTIDKWCWNSNIFDGNITYFKTKNEAENHYEKILDKYNIPVEYIIRRGYNKDKDED
jgi:hypothetical protein